MSILLAFTVDAWYEDRQERERFGALVQLIRADISEEVLEMEARNLRADSILAALDELLLVSDRSDLELGSDSLAALAQWVWNASSFTPSLSAFEVARGSQAWDRIPPEANARLAEYLGGFTSFDNEVQVRAMSGLIELASQYGGVPALRLNADGTPGPGDVAGFVSDPLFSSWVWAHRAVTSGERSWRTDWIRDLRDIEGVLAAL